MHWGVGGGGGGGEVGYWGVESGRMDVVSCPVPLISKVIINRSANVGSPVMEIVIAGTIYYCSYKYNGVSTCLHTGCTKSHCTRSLQQPRDTALLGMHTHFCTDCVKLV